MYERADGNQLPDSLAAADFKFDQHEDEKITEAQKLKRINHAVQSRFLSALTSLPGVPK